jgi:hypothetical protein
VRPKGIIIIIMMDYVRERTIPTERPPLVGLWIGVCRVVSAADPNGRNIGFLDLSRYFFLSSSSSVALTRLGGPRSRSTTFSENLVAPGIEPVPLDL